MNPTSLKLTNVRTFADLDLDIPDGITALVGPNGAGKSTLVNALDVALFAERGELAQLLTVGEDTLEIELTFLHGGDTYRVRRQHDGRGRGKSTLDFEQQPDISLVWESLTCESVQATQERINATLGLSRQTFRASAFVGQGDGAAFCEAQPRDRKSILSEILALGRWDEWAKRASGLRRQAEDEITGLRAKAEQLQAIADTRSSIEARLFEDRAWEADIIAKLGDSERTLAQARDALAAQAANEERVRFSEEAHRAALAATRSASDERAAATAAATLATRERQELLAVSALAERVPELEARVAELTAQRNAVLDAERERDTLLDEADRRSDAIGHRDGEEDDLRAHATVVLAKAEALANEESDPCDRCGQPLNGEARERAIRSYRQEGFAAEQKANEIRRWITAEDEAIVAIVQRAQAILIPEHGHIEPVARDLADARAAGERRAALAEIVRQHEEKAATLPQAEQALTEANQTLQAAWQRFQAAREALGDVDAFRAAAQAASDAVTRHRASLDDVRARVVRAEAEIERCQQAEQELAACALNVRNGTLRVDLYALAERAFGRDGIPALILEASAIPQIETEANRILADFGTPYRVELRTQRALKTADHLRETLDIVVSDGLYDRDYATFSGGERTRINLALRLALAGLLANRRGAESRVLCIDEPDNLDAAGMEQLIAILAGLSTTFSRILVVSHHPLLASAFDNVIEIRKTGERSQIVEVGSEAVAV